MLPLALALAVARHGQPARFTCTEVSQHALTHISVIEAFLPLRFEVPARAVGQGRMISLAPRDGAAGNDGP